ncbi:MAG: hypothetical protein IJ489_11490 [Clostridia bacterium]|nr:hypothetical protein [Clostridia bacterium]
MDTNTTQMSYTFKERHYTDRHSFVVALAEDWEYGKNALSDGTLHHYFCTEHPDLAELCKKAEETILAEPMDAEVIFLDFLYQLDPLLIGFYKKGRFYDSFSAFGEEMLEMLYADDTSEQPYWDSILHQRILTKYMERLFGNTEYLQKAEVLENMLTDEDMDQRSLLLRDYAMAYLIADDIFFRINDQKLRNVSELTQYMKDLLEQSYEAFEDFCHTLVDYNDVLDVQLEAFLLALGKQKELLLWREGLS